MDRKLAPSRRIVSFLTCTLAVPTVSYLLYRTPDGADMETLAPYLAVGAALGAAHLLLRPLLRLVTAPLGCITFGLSGTAIDVGLIYLSARFVRGFPAPQFLCALLTALLINAVNALVGARR